MKGSNFFRPRQMIDSSRSDNEHITPPPRSTIYVTLLQLVGLLALNIGAQAEPIYQSQDALGVPHFLDRPRREGLSDRLTPAKSFRDLARQHLTSYRITNDVEASQSKNLDDQPLVNADLSQALDPLTVRSAVKPDSAST